MLGICHGFPFLAKKNGFKIKKNHIGNHIVNFEFKKLKIVNSYHNEIIKNKRKKRQCFCPQKTIQLKLFI